MAAHITAALADDPSGDVAAQVIGQADTGSGKMADVSRLLDLLGPREREKLLVAFVGKMFTPKPE
jgi:hypothetical protein